MVCNIIVTLPTDTHRKKHANREDHVGCTQASRTSSDGCTQAGREGLYDCTPTKSTDYSPENSPSTSGMFIRFICITEHVVASSRS